MSVTWTTPEGVQRQAAAGERTFGTESGGAGCAWAQAMFGIPARPAKIWLRIPPYRVFLETTRYGFLSHNAVLSLM